MPFLLASLAAACYGCADFMGGIAARRAPVLLATLVSQSVGLLALLIAAPLFGAVATPADLGWGAAAGISGGLGVLLLYRALAIGTVSTTAPLVSMIALCVPVAAGLALGDTLGWAGGLGIAVALAAVLLISVGPAAHADARPDPTRVREALWTAVVSGVLVGAFLVCLGQVSMGAGLWPLVVARLAGTLLLGGLAAARRESRRLPAPAWPPVLVAGVADVVANVLYVTAVQRGPLSLIATIVSLAPASTVLLAQIVLRERLGAAQRWGVALALLAVALLAQGTAGP